MLEAYFLPAAHPWPSLGGTTGTVLKDCVPVSRPPGTMAGQLMSQRWDKAGQVWDKKACPTRRDNGGTLFPCRQGLPQNEKSWACQWISRDALDGRAFSSAAHSSAWPLEAVSGLF